ncbi:MAG: PAS domain-containing protein [Deltaproteobacteria bacterium]|nr:PAS domain-containing protein [Deltaproteobacteria bacterium]
MPASRKAAVRTTGSSSAREFFVVGIGASAGGLDAFKQLFSTLSPDTGMAFVVVQHLSPRHDSLLSTLVARMTPMPVAEVEDGMRVERNHVYIIPPNARMSLEHGVLKLHPRDEGERPLLSIDFFFRSLAHDRKDRAIAVVLSGTGSDGAEGAKLVKAEGGISFAQTPESARYGSMPARAIVVDDIDFVLPPVEIGRELSKLSRASFAARSKTGTGADEKGAGGDDLERILLLLKQTTGTDFSQYKLTTIRRRVIRRMILHKIDKLKGYLRLLQSDAKERKALSEDVLINVTMFFREPEAFDYLAAKILPALFKRKAPDEPLRIWVPGCSTGEEVYSIAICVLEVMGGQATPTPVQIFATDLSDRCIDKARLGRYPEGIAEHVSPERLKKYFNKLDGGYRVAKGVRDLCVFARHDLTRDPPFSKLDLISCRNVLIYLSQPLQSRIMETFHYSLRPNGYLFLGNSETIGAASGLFSLTDSKCKVYFKKSALDRPQARARDWKAYSTVESPKPPKVSSAVAPSPNEIQTETDRAILTRFSPPAVVVSSSFDVLQFRGHTEPFLSHKAGEASLNLVKLLREGLSAKIKAALEEAKKKDASVRKEAIPSGGVTAVSVEVTPLKFLPGERCFLVTFEPVDTSGEKRLAARRKLTKKGKGKQAVADPLLDENLQLKQELASTKDHLQSVIHDVEHANQDLQSANEEIISSNEELQSTNEELETSKEELQSTNEELSTVNEELQTRNQELFALNNDLVNILDSVFIPIIIVDNDLGIRRFTPLASKLFNVIPTDIGRPLTDLSSNVIDVAGFEQLILEVLESATIREREIQDKEGHWYQLRVRPYKTQEQKLDGAVVTLMDINQLKQSRDLAEAVVETVRQPFLVLDANLRVVKANDAFLATFHVSLEQTERKFVHELAGVRGASPALKGLLEEILSEKKELVDFEVNCEVPMTGRKKLLLNARQVPKNTILPKLILLTFEDITAQR